MTRMDLRFCAVPFLSPWCTVLCQLLLALEELQRIGSHCFLGCNPSGFFNFRSTTETRLRPLQKTPSTPQFRQGTRRHPPGQVESGVPGARREAARDRLRDVPLPRTVKQGEAAKDMKLTMVDFTDPAILEPPPTERSAGLAKKELIRHRRQLTMNCMRGNEESAIVHGHEDAQEAPRAYNGFSLSGNNPLNHGSHSKGASHTHTTCLLQGPL